MSSMAPEAIMVALRLRACIWEKSSRESLTLRTPRSFLPAEWQALQAGPFSKGMMKL